MELTKNVYYVIISLPMGTCSAAGFFGVPSDTRLLPIFPIFSVSWVLWELPENP